MLAVQPPWREIRVQIAGVEITKKEEKMNIEKMTIGEAREIAKLFGNANSKNHSFDVGKNYFIRTVTHHFTGKLVSVTDTDLVIVDAAWIADDGRFAQAISDGKHNEVEPFPAGLPVIINRASIIDACEYRSPLPRDQK